MPSSRRSASSPPTAPYDGFDLAMAKELCARLGWEYEAVAIDWNSKDAKLSSGTINCIWNGFTYTGRENDYTFSDPYVDNSIVMVVKADSGITSLADLAGKSVMAQAASSAVDAIKTTRTSRRRSRRSWSWATTTWALWTSPRARWTPWPLTSALRSIRSRTTTATMSSSTAPSPPSSIAIGFLKGNTELRDAVNAELLKMAEDGTMLEIAQKYVDQGLVLDSLCLINK